MGLVRCPSRPDRNRARLGRGGPIPTDTEPTRHRQSRHGTFALDFAAAAFAPALEQPLPNLPLGRRGVPTVQFGQSRAPLIRVEDAVRRALNQPAQQALVEQRLLDILPRVRASIECKRFVCRRPSHRLRPLGPRAVGS